MPDSVHRTAREPRLLWRVAVYLLLVALAVPFLRGDDRLSHGPQLAALTAAVLRMMGVPAAGVDDVVSGGGFAMRVAPICDGADLAFILASAIVLSPAPYGLRLAGVAATAVLTQVFNLGRLVCMYLVGVHLREHFDLFHHVLWQPVAILFCVALYVLWSHRMAMPARER